jgi:phenylacetate-CoA ligase
MDIMEFEPADWKAVDGQVLVDIQRRKLKDMLSVALASNSFYMRKYAGLKFDPLIDSLSELPFTTRQELQQDQAEHPPYGSNLTCPPDHYIRLHQTSATSGGAPLRWLDTPDSWNWVKKCWRTIYHAAGVQPGDRMLFPFSFGPFLGFWAAFESSIDMGCLTIAGGGMTTLARLCMIQDNAITIVGCTPTYALRMAEVAASKGIDLAASTVRALIVAGEPGGCIAASRARMESSWGARVFDHSGMTEIGSCTFECTEAPGGLHVIESEFIPEVINPETGEIVDDGALGELVLTNLGRTGSPLIRYRTGDQVRMLRERCACGRWFARFEGGILGRTDDMLLIRGNNVFPAAVEEIIRSFPIVEFRATARQALALTELKIEIELAPGADREAISKKLSETIRDRFNFRPMVVAVADGTLPRYEMKARRFIREQV